MDDLEPPESDNKRSRIAATFPGQVDFRLGRNKAVDFEFLTFIAQLKIMLYTRLRTMHNVQGTGIS